MKLSKRGVARHYSVCWWAGGPVTGAVHCTDKLRCRRKCRVILDQFRARVGNDRVSPMRSVAMDADTDEAETGLPASPPPTRPVFPWTARPMFFPQTEERAIIPTARLG
jgi:hypothetical protein